MALTPIPYTKSWSDVFGSKDAPIETAAKIAPPTVLPSLNLPQVTLTIGATNPVLVEWGDGATTPLAGGVVNHTYERMGNYLIRVTDVQYPDIYVEVEVRIDTLPVSFQIAASGEAGVEEELMFLGNWVFPVSISWGDGESDYLPIAAESIEHIWAEAGTFLVSVMDGVAKNFTKSITISPAAPLEGPTNDDE